MMMVVVVVMVVMERSRRVYKTCDLVGWLVGFTRANSRVMLSPFRRSVEKKIQAAHDGFFFSRLLFLDDLSFFADGNGKCTFRGRLCTGRFRDTGRVQGCETRPHFGIWRCHCRSHE